MTFELLKGLGLALLVICVLGCKEQPNQTADVNKKCPFKGEKWQEFSSKCEEGIANCVKKCEENGPLAKHYCFQARYHFRGEKNESELRKILLLACKNGVSKFCLEYADSYIFDVYNPSLPEKVPFENYKKYAAIRKEYLPLMEKRCHEKKDADACLVLSDHYKENWPNVYVESIKPPEEVFEIKFKKDANLVMKYLKLACEYGNWDNCNDVGLINLGKLGQNLNVTPRRDEAEFYFTCGCENGYSLSCDQLEELKK